MAPHSHREHLPEPWESGLSRPQLRPRGPLRDLKCTPPSLFLIQGPHTFPVKGPILTLLGPVAHVVSVATTRPGHRGVEASTDHRKQKEWPCCGHTELTDQDYTRPPLPLPRKTCLSHHSGAQGSFLFFCLSSYGRTERQGDTQRFPRGTTVRPQPHKGALAPHQRVLEAHGGLRSPGLPEPCSPGSRGRVTGRPTPCWCPECTNWLMKVAEEGRFRLGQSCWGHVNRQGEGSITGLGPQSPYQKDLQEYVWLRT